MTRQGPMTRIDPPPFRPVEISESTRRMVALANAPLAAPTLDGRIAQTEGMLESRRCLKCDSPVKHVFRTSMRVQLDHCRMGCDGEHEIRSYQYTCSNCGHQGERVVAIRVMDLSPE